MEQNKNLFAVIDLEATCNNEPELPKEQMETIEIGVVLIDLDTLTCVSTFEQKVCPTLIANVTPFCTELTGIKKENVEHAPDFEEAVKLLDDWICRFTHQKVSWGSWGWYDAEQIKQDCKRYSSTEKEVAIDSLGLHCNLKKMFAKQNKKEVGKQKGLMGALRMLGKEFEGHHHSALADAKNIARVIHGGSLKINEEEIVKYSRMGN